MIVQNNQNIFDVVIQEFGQLDNLFEVLNDNNIDVNSKLTSSQILIINTQEKGNNLIKNYINLNNLKLNNSQDENYPPSLGGDYSDDYNNDYY